MTKKVVPARTGLASTHTRDVYYGYDARGQQLYARFDGASSSSEGLTTVYDALGRMTSSALKMDGVTRTLSYTWARDGNRAQLTLPAAQQAGYPYARIQRITIPSKCALAPPPPLVSHPPNHP